MCILLYKCRNFDFDSKYTFYCVRASVCLSFVTFVLQTTSCANSCLYYINLTDNYTNILIMNKYIFYHSEEEELVAEEELLKKETGSRSICLEFPGSEG